MEKHLLAWKLRPQANISGLALTVYTSCIFLLESSQTTCAPIWGFEMLFSLPEMCFYHFLSIEVLFII